MPLGISNSDSSTKNLSSSAGDVSGSGFWFGGQGNTTQNQTGILIAVGAAAVVITIALFLRHRRK